MEAPMIESSSPRAAPKLLGFWSCWSLTVGIMIGSGVFTLPAVLAKYGTISFGGWLISGAGSILIALTVARLAARATRSGGPYVYARDAFGDLTGFLIAWGYWSSYWIAIPAMAIAFAGYLPVLSPAFASPAMQGLAALVLIWTLTLVAVRGVQESARVQLVMTLMKLAPLLALIALGAVSGDVARFPAVNPTGDAPIAALAATALLTAWAFSGLEAGCLPAGDVREPQRTIPRAVVAGTLTATAIYLGVSAAAMALVPAHQLAKSTAPLADAARAFGDWGPAFVAIGALVATAGALNGTIFVAGQMPMAVALDRLAPTVFARRNAGGAPVAALLLSATLGTALLAANYTRGAIDAFTFLLTMSTITALTPLLVSAAAELRHSWRSARGWAAVAALAGLYCVFAIVGSGLQAMAWGAVLLMAGAPVYWWGRTARQ
jgi:APA family basic amino acid/polyamine antiporter